MSAFDNFVPRVVLASRENAGIRVTLLWAAATNTAAVLVQNDAVDDQFELVVEPDVNPLDVYEHPYAYAAWRGVEYRTTEQLRPAA
jgi:hypothetical protein